MVDHLNIDDQNLREQLNRVHRDLSVLYDISNAMRTTLELNHILYIILTGVTAHFGLGFNRAILFLVNQKDQSLECKMVIGPESGEDAQKIWRHIGEAKQDLEDLISADNIAQHINHQSAYSAMRALKIPIGIQEHNLLATAYHKGTPLHITRDMIAQYSHDPLLKVFHTNELVVMPLKAKDKINGLIVADNLYTQKPITSDDLKIFTMLANQAGLAIENSQLYEIIVHKSHTDSLTNLWNHGFFQHKLSEELQRAQKENSSLSLMIIDIDNFKLLNDTYGHQNGDIVLRELAVILRKSSREMDYICRYGGEEFSIILPQINREQGFAIAERIRQAIAQQEFPNFPPNKNLKVTVSIGLATYPLDATTKEDLIAKADKAMYIAKFSGKNMTSLVQPEST